MTTDKPVGVYYSGQDYISDAPAFFVERETARAWVRSELAWSVNHGRDIALNADAESELTGEIDARKLIGDWHAGRQGSQVMGEHVMRANAQRERWAVRMTQAWQRTIAAVEHLRSLRRYQELRKSGVLA